MHQILLQPASKPIAIKNYKNTILNPIPLKKILSIIEEDVLDINVANLDLNQDLHIWGITNHNKWKRIRQDDAALFYKKGRIIAGMNVSSKLISRKLAEYLWNSSDWRYIYFGRSLVPLGCPIEDFNKMVGYKKIYRPHKFDILSQDNKNRSVDTNKVLRGIGFTERFDQTSEPELPQLLSLDQVATILNLKKDIVIQLIKESDLKGYKFGEKFRVNPIDLNKFLFNHEV